MGVFCCCAAATASALGPVRVVYDARYESLMWCPFTTAAWPTLVWHADSPATAAAAATKALIRRSFTTPDSHARCGGPAVGSDPCVGTTSCDIASPNRVPTSTHPGARATTS